MSYQPTQVSQGSKQDFTRWLDDELRKISQAFDQVDNLQLVPLAAEPSRYQEGLIIYADGANFDPGDGAGTYQRGSAGWDFLAGAGGGGASIIAGTIDGQVARWNDPTQWQPATGVFMEATTTPPTALVGYLRFNTTSTTDEQRAQMMWSALNTTSTHYFAQTSAAPDGFYCRTNSGAQTHSWGVSLAGTDTEIFRIDETDRFVIPASAHFFMGEKAAAISDVGGFGQFWVRNDAPNTPMFTDDTGVDHELNAAGGGTTVNPGTFANTMLRWDGVSAWVEETQINITGAGIFNLLNVAGTHIFSTEVQASDVVQTFTSNIGAMQYNMTGGLFEWQDNASTVFTIDLDNTAIITEFPIYGGEAAGSILELQGARNGAPDVGIVQINSPITLDYDTFSNTTPAQQFAMSWAPTPSISSNYVGGALSTAAVFDVTTGVFIPAIFSDTNRYNIGAAPGFSAITFINELSVVANNGNFNLPSALVMNIGLVHERTSSGTSTTPGATGVSFSPQTRATVSGAVITKTTQIALRVAPTFSSVAGSTTNLGTVIGVQMNDPSVALFQPQAGTENVTAVYGLVMNAMTKSGNITRAAVLSGLAAATNSFVILNTGTAQSDFGAGSAHFDDNAGIQLGGLTNAARDVLINWNASALEFDFAANSDRMTISNPGANRILIDQVDADHEFNFNCNRFSLGAQTGAVGNQVGVFVAPTRTVSVGGEWSDFLLTQAGNITVDAAMGLVAGWTINAPSITLGTGSVTTAAGLNIGGNPTGATNRVGLRIISNPSGGGGVNAALWVTAGLTQLDGDLGHAGTNLGFYGTAPIAKQLAVPVTAAGVHAALVALGLIT